MLLAPPARAAWPTDPTVNVPLCTAADNQFVPTIATDGAGGAIVTWMDRRGTNGYDIYAQHLKSSGDVDPAWPFDGVLLCGASQDQEFPVIVADGAGGAIVAWIDHRGADADLYAQHVTAAGAADPAWPVNGAAVCTFTGDQLSPVIVADAGGGAILAWYDLRRGIDYDIYAQHVRAIGSTDPAWPADGLAICTAPSFQLSPAISPDGAGGAVITWSDPRDGSSFDIYAQHALAGGTVDPAWPADGLALCTASGDQIAPAIVVDGSGGAIVTWMDSRNGGGYDVFAQHVLAGGTVDPGWPANGQTLSAAAGDQGYPKIVSDDAGGAIAVWSDYRTGNSDIYGQRVLATGVVDPAWPVGGAGVGTAAGDQTLPAVVADGASGVIVAWMDRRNGNDDDVYAQHLTSAGVTDIGWPAAGVAIGTAARAQIYPSAVTDGAHGALVAWEDFRTGFDYDIYAQRLFANGRISDAVVGAPEHGVRVLALALEPPSPNPSRGIVNARFTLPGPGVAMVELFDVAGRRVDAREVLSSGAGRHAVALGTARRLTPGIYTIRLRQGSEARVARIAVVE